MPVNNADRNLEERVLASQKSLAKCSADGRCQLVAAVSSAKRADVFYRGAAERSTLHGLVVPNGLHPLTRLGLQRASTRVLVTFYFRLLISISGCSFFSLSVDKLLEFMETWGSAISFATCQHGNRAKYRPPIHACLRH